MDFNRALEFARDKHEDTDDRKGTGLPYITHPEAVAGILRDLGFGTDHQIAGLFHDLLEDTDATEKEILDYGNPEILEAVKLVTKDGSDTASYIEGISRNKMAAAVKIADRIHNLSDSIEHPDHDWQKRYLEESEKYYMKLAEMEYDANGKSGQLFLDCFLEKLNLLKDYLGD